MRCLRCAIDYGPDAQYCDRCGRALSRPPGSKKPAATVEDPVNQESRFMYSTFAPPATQATRAQVDIAPPPTTPLPPTFAPIDPAPARKPLPPSLQTPIEPSASPTRRPQVSQAKAPAETIITTARKPPMPRAFEPGEKVDAPARQRPLPPSVYLARPAAHERTREARQPAPARPVVDAPQTEPSEAVGPAITEISTADNLSPGNLTRRRDQHAAASTTPAASPVNQNERQPLSRRQAERAAATPEPAIGASSRLRARLEKPPVTTSRRVSGAFPDEPQFESVTGAQAPTLKKLKSTSIDADMAIWRRPAPGRRRGPVTSGRIAATVVLVVGIAGGVAGYDRYETYSNDVRAGQSFYNAGQYTLAVAKFNQAIGEWPFNNEAKNGLSQAESANNALIQRKKATLDVVPARAIASKVRSLAPPRDSAQVDMTTASTTDTP
jgi:hypothetical protein